MCSTSGGTASALQVAQAPVALPAVQVALLSIPQPSAAALYRLTYQAMREGGQLGLATRKSESVMLFEAARHIIQPLYSGYHRMYTRP